MKQKMTYLAMLAVGGTLALSGCATKVAKCTGDTDTPQHHYLMGMKALEEGRIPVAQEKFERSLYCNEEYSLGYDGLAIVGSEKAKAQPDSGFRATEVERATESLNKGKKFADKTDEFFDYYVAGIRTRSTLKQKGWLSDAEDAYKDAMKLKVDERALIYYQGTEAATYFMGIAYLEALEFTKARDNFAEVLNAKRESTWHEKADKAWKKVDKIVLAMAGITVGDVGRKIALKESVTRADLAALLIDELKVEKLMAGRIPVASQAPKAEFTPADVLSHPFREEVLTLMKWKVRGIEPKYDETTKAYLFKPADPVSRAEMAFILEDVLIKLTGNESLATAYFGQDKSPFPDVKSTSPFYNAVMNMTTRGIMEGELSGEFRISDPVNGAEALLAMRMLKQKINVY
ncbi:MAG TPA: S-layer homology domain-containing protein [Desulfuromonadales bacterium]|nr:S-layer homology domain-containing protein [Desulfuromonadales bacterium]